MSVFEARLSAQRKGLCELFQLDSIDTYYYVDGKEELLSLFEDYIGMTYSSSEKEKIGDYHNFNLTNEYLSDAFSNEEKEYIYNLYSEISNYIGLFDYNPEDETSQFDRMKVYYKIN